jgi:hypothetical protein
MFAADSRIAAGQTASDMIRAQYASQLNLNSVAAIASALGTRLQGGRSVTDLSGAGPFAVLKYPQYGGGLNVIDSNDFSTYHGMILQFQRRSYHGFGLQFSYTLAKALDTRSYDPTFTVVSTGSNQSAGSSPWDMYNRKLNYGTADYDLRSVFQWNGTYEMPFGKGKRFGNTSSSILNRVIGGWELAGFGRWSSGRPFTVYSGSNSFSSVVQSPANCMQCTHGTGQAFDDPVTGLKWFFDGGIRSMFPGAPGQPSNVPNVAPGQLGNTGRNFFRTPQYFDLDAAFIKRTKITERFNLELRADATNITNTPSFDNPTATVTSSTFGRIRNSLTSASRKFQIGTKLNF